MKNVVPSTNIRWKYHCGNVVIVGDEEPPTMRTEKRNKICCFEFMICKTLEKTFYNNFQSIHVGKETRLRIINIERKI